jgi:hypothetical protein
LISQINLSFFENPLLGRAVFPAHRSHSYQRQEQARVHNKEQIEMMMERLLEIEVGPDGTLTEEIELICTMTGFRRRFLVHHMGEGFFRSLELEAS